MSPYFEALPDSFECSGAYKSPFVLANSFSATAPRGFNPSLISVNPSFLLFNCTIIPFACSTSPKNPASNSAFRSSIDHVSVCQFQFE